MTKMDFRQVESREIKAPLAYFVSSTFSLNSNYKVRTCQAARLPQTKENFINVGEGKAFTYNTNPKTKFFIRQFSGIAKTKFLRDKLPVSQNKTLLNRYTSPRNSVNRKVIPKRKQTFLHQSSKKASFIILQKQVLRTGVRITGNKKVLQKQGLNSIFNQVLLASNHFYRLDSNRKLGYLYPTNLDKMSFLSSDLADLPLSLNTYTFLKQKGIHKIGSLVAYSQNDLLQLLNRDRKMFAEIKRSSLLTAICGNA